MKRTCRTSARCSAVISTVPATEVSAFHFAGFSNHALGGMVAIGAIIRRMSSVEREVWLSARCAPATFARGGRPDARTISLTSGRLRSCSSLSAGFTRVALPSK
jgi:hypothetical protein